MQFRRPGFGPWVRKIFRRREWQSTLVFLPGESHGQRHLAGYSLWGHKESDTTERLTYTHTHTHTHVSVLGALRFLSLVSFGFPWRLRR